jgi:hypothetical protein
MRRGFGLHPERQARTAREAFAADRGPEGEAQRAAEIAALPAVEWKGRTLYSLHCSGDYGNGPHVVNAPESLLWSLLDLRVFRCPYHR